MTADEWAVLVTVPLDLPDYLKDALFQAIGDAVTVWEPPDRTWDPLITGAPLNDVIRIDQEGVTVRVAPGVTLHGDTGAFTATADAPPAAVARLLRQLADDLDRQEER